MNTPDQIADSLGIDWGSSYTPSRDDIVRAIEADRAQRFTDPDLPGVHVQPHDVFENMDGERLLDVSNPFNGGELILVRADGTTASIRGNWTTGYDA